MPQLAAAVARRLSIRYSIVVEALLLLGLYLAYQSSRGVAAAKADAAFDHADELILVERRLHLLHEDTIQQVVDAVPGLMRLLGLGYVSLHLAVTACALVWLYACRPAFFALVRSALAVSSAIALAFYFVYPTAPPRLLGIGIEDTVAVQNHLDLASPLLGWTYNPYAAVPSMHFGYALIVGVAVARLARARLLRLAATAYPGIVFLIIVATGNHFIVDAVLGAIVGCVGSLVAVRACAPELLPSRGTLKQPLTAQQ